MNDTINALIAIHKKAQLSLLPYESLISMLQWMKTLTLIPRNLLRGKPGSKLLSHAGENAVYLIPIRDYSIYYKFLIHFILSEPENNASKRAESCSEKREQSEGLLCVDTCSTQVVSICSLS